MLNDDATGFLLIIGLITVNQLAMWVGALRSNMLVFWGVQALNLTVACGILLWGLPGFERWPIVSWIFGLLVLFRMMQNNGQRASYLRNEVHAGGGSSDRAQAIRDALSRGSDGASEE